MRAKAYAIGVENTVYEKRRLLFLDVDVDKPNYDIQEFSEYCLNLLRRYGNLLILRSKHGFQLVCFSPLRIKPWQKWIRKAISFADVMFCKYALEYGYSVLRISPKISIEDGVTVTNNLPEVYRFVENQGYPGTQLLLLFSLIYGLKPEKANWNSIFMKYKPRLHFYITGGD